MSEKKEKKWFGLKKDGEILIVLSYTDWVEFPPTVEYMCGHDVPIDEEGCEVVEVDIVEREGGLSMEALNAAFAKIEKHDLKVGTVCIPEGEVGGKLESDLEKWKTGPKPDPRHKDDR